MKPAGELLAKQYQKGLYRRLREAGLEANFLTEMELLQSAEDESINNIWGKGKGRGP